MDAQSLAAADTITTPPKYSAMEILQRQRAAGNPADELPALAAGAAASAGTSSPPDKQAKKKEKKLQKQGVRTRFSGQVPVDLGLDRSMTITASAKVDEDTGAMVQFRVVVPPGIQPGQAWHFKTQPGEPGELWPVVETLKVEDPVDEHALPGTGQAYECVSRAVLRAGLDTLSKQVGFCERGEQRVCLESRVYAGRTRVRFEEGWTSVRSGSGRRLLKKIDGLAPWLQAEQEAKERAVAWLELQGYPPPVIEKVLDLFLDAGYKPNTWLDRLGDMPQQEMEDMVTAATKAQAREDELCSYMEEAGAQLIAGTYTILTQHRQSCANCYSIVTSSADAQETMVELSRGTMLFSRLTQTTRKPNEGCLRQRKVHAWQPSRPSSCRHTLLQRWVMPQVAVVLRLLLPTYSVIFDYLNIVTSSSKS